MFMLLFLDFSISDTDDFLFGSWEFLPCPGLQNNILHPSPDVHTLFPQTCEYVTLCGKIDFADVIKNLKWGDYPGIFGWTCLNTWVGKRRDKEEDSVAGFVDGGRGLSQGICSLQEQERPSADSQRGDILNERGNGFPPRASTRNAALCTPRF